MCATDRKRAGLGASVSTTSCRRIPGFLNLPHSFSPEDSSFTFVIPQGHHRHDAPSPSYLGRPQPSALNSSQETPTLIHQSCRANAHFRSQMIFFPLCKQKRWPLVLIQQRLKLNLVLFHPKSNNYWKSADECLLSVGSMGAQQELISHVLLHQMDLFKRANPIGFTCGDAAGACITSDAA